MIMVSNRTFIKIFNVTSKALLFLPPEASHFIALQSLKFIFKLGLLKFFFSQEHKEKKEFQFFKNKVPNRLGLAAGLDKNGDYIDCLAALGFGFVELGTVTPKPQEGNPKPRMFRLKSKNSLINKMGFNNKGVDYLVSRIYESESNSVIGVSIGKNFDTPIEEALNDYVFCLNKVYEVADYIVINISSPNTEDLRKLESERYFESLISSLKVSHQDLSKNHGYKPLLLKISPDMQEDQLEHLSSVILDKRVDGVICSNTSDSHNYKYGGGLSGEELFRISTNTLCLLRKKLGKEITIIASGGVMGKSHFKEKIEAGADFVQIYTGMIFEGPGLVTELIEFSNSL